MTPESARPFIEIRRLVKAYGDNVILKGIDLDIAPGEFIVLVGPSGCGKSTLLRCIAGLEQISEGDLFIDGRRCNDVPPKDRDLAMVFQSYALYPHLTVAQNLAFSLTVRKLPKDEIKKRVDEAAQRLGLTALLDRLPKQMSGGQRQRVAVGRAIVRQPQAFLFDEPLSNLDAALRGQMRVELRKLHHDMHATMIYVTHDQVEAMTLADRIVVLEGGVARQIGTPAELYNTPADKFVAHFIGSPPMNFLPASFKENCASGMGFALPLPDAYGALDGEAREVFAGVRPMSLTLDGDGAGRVEATVEVVEPVGWEAYIHARCGEHPLVAQAPAAACANLQVGQTVAFRVDAGDVHLFDRATEKAIKPE